MPTARRTSSGSRPGRAASRPPIGPFIDTSAAPFACQTTLGGSIDPSPFVNADGTPYLVWKSTGAGGQPTTDRTVHLHLRGAVRLSDPSGGLHRPLPLRECRRHAVPRLEVDRGGRPADHDLVATTRSRRDRTGRDRRHPAAHPRPELGGRERRGPRPGP